MRSGDLDLLIIPGLSGSGPGHWQSRWQDKLATARRVEMPDWERPDCAGWSAALRAAVAACTRPVVLIAHSLGVLSVVHAATGGDGLGSTVRGAFLVAPPDEMVIADIPAIDPAFRPVPRRPLPWPGVLIASSDDPYCPRAAAQAYADAWGIAFSDAGAAGHINLASGHGPWPEGLMRLAGFLGPL